MGTVKPFRVLSVDSDAATLELIRERLGQAGLEVTTALSGAEAIRVLEFRKLDLVIVDIHIPDIEGLSLLRFIREHFKDLEVIMTAQSPTVPEAVEAIKGGAENFLVKPLREEELQSAVDRLIDKRNRRQEAATSSPPAQAYGFAGESEGIRKVIERIDRAASTSANVLIHGESGTGKELVARAIHYRGDRAAARFVPINCTAIPDTLLESELFGHVKGAFTGARDSRAGFFQIADGGTIFLDEIGDASINMQGKLLRVLQNKEIHIVGSSHVRKVDTRIIAATHKDLQSMVKKGLFREDLYYRLVVIDIHIPPLRERPDDILPLVSLFLTRFSREMNRTPPAFTDRALETLKGFDWPGNVRELENLIQRLLVNTDGDTLEVADLPDAMRAARYCPVDDLRPLAAVESEHISRVLTAVNDNKTRAAEILGIDRKTLREKLKRISPNP
ncbi:MAG: sigma-54-dependent transcriptional regulator [Desulfobacterales bacterium]